MTTRQETTWFDTARFGMFVHWGHSSQRGCELSWPLVGGVANLPFGGSVPVEEYHSTASTFNPQQWDAKALARMAKDMGMQYAILTSKHHDGFSMFHTRQSDFSIEHAPYGKDIVRDFVAAMRAEGLRVGLYFSLIDWHHPDYPAFIESDKPYQFFNWKQPTPEQWERFTQFMFAQIRELLTNYGRIDVLWFDGGWERSIDQWKAYELEAMIRELQPNILINDRLPGFGDFDTPEQFIPAQPTARTWETCMTINESWGYNPSDTQLKSARQLIHALCEVAGKGGNLLLNVSPMGDGALPLEQVERLQTVGAWMAQHGESIVGTAPGLEPWQFYGPSTRKGDCIYLHLLMKPYDSISVRGVPIKRVKSVQVLGSGQALAFSTRCAIVDAMFNPDPLGELTIPVPASAVDPYATVIKLEIGPA